jgi:AcrR family transcriptional regulator
MSKLVTKPKPKPSKSASLSIRQRSRRPYDAFKTQKNILEAARRSFTDRGFDHVGLREIAALAGVDPALVIRYFGSKEKLFLVAIGSDFHLIDYWGDDPKKVGECLAERILTAKATADCYDPFLLILRSAPNEAAAKLLKGKLQADVIDPIAAKLSGSDVQLRASLIAAVLIGLAFTKDVVQVEGIARASSDKQKKHYANLIQCCVDGI